MPNQPTSTTGSASRPACVLLTLGRLPVCLELARGFHSLGWRVLVAEPFGMHMARTSRCVERSFKVTAPRTNPAGYLKELADLVVQQKIDLVIPVSEETVHVAALAESLAPPCEVFSPGQSSLLELHDKYRFNQLAAGLALDVPRSYPAGSCKAMELVASTGTVFKPRFSCSGRGVRFLQPGDALPDKPDAMVQVRVDGASFSSFSLARKGKLCAMVIYRPVISSGSVAVCFERCEGIDPVEQWVRQFVEATAHDGFIAFDFIVDHQGRAQAIECNPRVTSGIHFFESESLARAILTPQVSEVSMRPEALLVESWSAFTTCLGSLLPGRGVPGAWSNLLGARDVSWSSRDPWPFLLGMINTAPLIARALHRRQTFAEVAALDIEWSAADFPIRQA